MQAAYVAEDTVLAAKITKSLRKDLEQQLKYYASLDEAKAESFDFGGRGGDKVAAEQLLMRLMQFEQQYKMKSGQPAETQVPITTQPVISPKPDSPKKK